MTSNKDINFIGCCFFQAKEFRPKTGITFDARELELEELEALLDLLALRSTILLARREEELDEEEERLLELLEEEEDLVAFFRPGTRIFLSFSKTFLSSTVSSSWLLLITLMIFSAAFSPT